MIKKLIKYLKLIIIGGIWSYFYFLLAGAYFISFWNFNIYSPQSWSIVSQYWESGGVIKTGKDYMLLLSLGLFLPLWLWGWHMLYKCNFIYLITIPYKLYNEHIIKAYSKAEKRIKIKNMGTASVKIEEEIEQKAKSQNKIATDEEVNKIRDAVAQKINSVSH